MIVWGDDSTDGLRNGGRFWVDVDLDGYTGSCDNCPEFANVNQANADGDGEGDVCDCRPSESSNRKPAEATPVASPRWAPP